MANSPTPSTNSILLQIHEFQVPIVGSLCIGNRQHKALPPIQEAGFQNVRSKEHPETMSNRPSHPSLLPFLQPHACPSRGIFIHPLNHLFQVVESVMDERRLQ